MEASALFRTYLFSEVVEFDNQTCYLVMYFVVDAMMLKLLR